jgi:phospholipase C
MSTIKHVFVLMLENRSFDHMLGLSKIVGTDAATGKLTQINGLTGAESNFFNGVSYAVGPNAPATMDKDPYHEFPDVLEQLCGPNAIYPKGPPAGPYPQINKSGFVSNYVNSAGAPIADAGQVMQCFPPSGVPVLYALANEFAVCDFWYSSLPGPTWPNRFFALGASSGDLDRSPTDAEIALWQTVDGFKFQNGSIFDRMPNNWRIYTGSLVFTLAHALSGIYIWDIHRYSRFANDISNPNYSPGFTWIEPNYGHVASDYLGGNSQHPLDGVAGGEALIKATYEAIRNSPLWNSSLFIITWDEHGGFFDHVSPPAAVAPGDVAQFASANEFGFDFKQYGVRVPGIVISPLIPRDTIDHRSYDHSSIPATLERLFNLQPLTKRDAQANDVLSLASLPAPRTDTPGTIDLQPDKSAAISDISIEDTLDAPLPEATRPDEAIEADKNLPGFVYLASRTDMELRAPELTIEAHVAKVRERYSALSTRRDARDYFDEVRRKVLASDRLRNQ